MHHAPGLVAMLEQFRAEIDRDLAQSNRQRAQAYAHLAASTMTSHGGQGTADQVNALMVFGEQYYRWKFFLEGVEYWKGLFQLIRRFVPVDHDYARRALTIAGAFSLLGGTMELDKPVTQSTLAMLAANFGEAHPLTQDCRDKIIAARGATGWSTAGADPGPFAQTSGPRAPEHLVDMTPSPKRQETAMKLSPKEELSLWITLAFLAIALADGTVSDAEHLVWKRAIQRANLPDLWDRFTTKGLRDLLDQGMLQALSNNFAALDRGTKITLGRVLKEIVFADGHADPREIDEVRKICGWIGLSITDIP